ncbi:hypothetical protein PE36_20739 [Moritella sp. PE36]|uniref:hypothetical protein n=1 Tax=Moritella sp. PE36 TaxID=58051 RepID=UPI0001568820|nr:hypothetical protein [Moritella sp. PE36]EDM68147.1 hypothetical protein PE36_20739 [Moritella sp. PE36]
MVNYLYRGVSIIDDKNNDGKILPKGECSSAPVYFGQEGVCFGGGYTFGSSEGNAVRAHQFDSDINHYCYISTTKCKDVAIRFATTGNLANGYVYTLDPSLFSEHGIVTNELVYAS